MIPIVEKTSFSVLLPVYRNDTPLFFKAAVDSVLKNTLTPDKVLIVVDGAVDRELEFLIADYSNIDIVHVLRLAHNVGLARALNSALELIDSDFVLRADADDINHPERFRIQIDALNRGLDLVGSSITEIDEKGLVIGKRLVPSSENEISRFAKMRNPFNHMTVGFRMSIARKIGGYPLIEFKEDYAFWALFIKHGAKMANIKESLVTARAGQSMYQRRGGLKYAISELKMQHHLWKCGVQAIWSGILIGLLRSVVFLMPNRLRALFYKFFLRGE
jgi:glycosyltransferase involved in cell wall biosynthesis